MELKESPEIELYATSELICSDADTAGQWEKDRAVSDWMSKWRKKLILTLTSHRTKKKIDSRWAADLHVKGELLKL